MSSKYLMCNSFGSRSHSDFRVNFSEPIIIPKNGQIRLINCRLNLEEDEVSITNLNNEFLFSIGWGWNKDGFSGLYRAVLPIGEYSTSNGTTARHLNQQVADALNAAVSNMRFYRGGFSCSVVGGALVIKLSSVAIPTDAHTASTESKWKRMGATLHTGNLARGRVQSVAVEPLTGGGATNWGNYIQGTNLSTRNTLTMGMPLSAPVSARAIRCKMDLNTFSWANDFEVELGITPADNCYRNAANVASLNIADWVYRRNEPLMADRRIQGNLAFKILNHNTGGLPIMQWVRRDSVGVGAVVETVIWQGDISVALQGQEIQVNIQFTDAASAATGFKYVVSVVNLSTGANLAGIDAVVPDDFYQMIQGDMINPISASSILFSREQERPATIIPYIYTAGNNVMNNGLWINCAWDDDGDGVSASANAVLPLFVFGRRLDANEIVILDNTAQMDSASEWLLMQTDSWVGEQVGFDTTSYGDVAGGASFSNGVTLQDLKPDREDQATYYLDCPSLPVKNYTGMKDFGRYNNYIGIIHLKQKAKDSLFPGESSTDCYVDLHNSFPLTFTNLTFRIVDFNGQEVQGLLENTILNLHIRQDPWQKQAERIADLLRPLMVGSRKNNEMVQPTVNITDKGQ